MVGVVAAAIFLFVAQVGTRVAVFFQYKTNVAVKNKYVKEIEFPAVTVCNQNNYRYVISSGESNTNPENVSSKVKLLARL